MKRFTLFLLSTLLFSIVSIAVYASQTSLGGFSNLQITPWISSASNFGGVATTTAAQVVNVNWPALISTTTAFYTQGRSQLIVYGTTTIQTPINTNYAFRVLNAASSSVFSVDTRNASTTVAGVLNVQSCNGCGGGGSGTINTGTLNTLPYYSAATTLDSATFLNVNTGSSLLGIGTTTPGSVLSIQGAGNFVNQSTSTLYTGFTLPVLNATSTTATSTFGNGLQLSNGCFKGATGNCLIASLNGLTGATQTFSKTNDTNVTLTITSSGIDHGFALGWSGTLGVARGGTNIGSYGTGDLLYASGATTLAQLTIGASSTILTTNGTSPAWSASPSLSTLRITGSGTSTFLTGDLQANTVNTTIATASSTFAGGVQIRAGGLQITNLNCTGFTNGGKLVADANGVVNCGNDSGGGGAGTINSGTLNRPAYYSGATTLDSANFSVFDFTNERFGISSTTPAAKLSIANAASVTAPLFLAATTTAGFATSTAFIIDNLGNVGIGTTSPATQFAINGRLYVNGNSGNATSSVFGTPVEVLGSATSSFAGGIKSFGLHTGNGLTVNAGNIYSLTAGTSTVLTGNLSAAGIAASSGLSLTGGGFRNTVAGTSTLLTGALDAAGIVSSAGLSLTGGGFRNTVTGTSSLLTGALDAAGLVSSAGITVTGQGLTNTVTGSSTRLAAVEATLLNITGTTATSTFANGIQLAGGGLKINTLNCTGFTNGGKLVADAQGVVNCGNDTGGGGGTPGGANTNIQFNTSSAFNGSKNFTWDDTNARLAIGANTGFANLSIFGTTTPSQLFEVSDSASTTRLKITSGGLIGVGPTSTPSGLLSIVGTSTNVFPMFLISTTTSANATSTAVVIDSNGRLGINTSSPSFALDVNGATQLGIGLETMRTVNGSVGIATTSPYAILGVSATSTAANSSFPILLVSTSTATASNTALIVDNNGRVGIGTTSPQAPFAVQGITILHGNVYMTNLTSSGAVQTITLCQNAANQVIAETTTCALSTIRVKDNIESLGSSLSTLMELRPVSFYYKKTGNAILDARGEQVGFIAEEALKIDRRLVEIGSDGLPRAFRYENFTALLAKGIQEIETQIKGLFIHDAEQDARIKKLEETVQKQQIEIEFLKVKLR